MARRPGALGRQLVMWGVVLTWVVGGVVGLEGWLLITATVRGEAEARVQDAVRVAERMVGQELERLESGGTGAVEVPADSAAELPALPPLPALAPLLARAGPAARRAASW